VIYPQSGRHPKGFAQKNGAKWFEMNRFLRQHYKSYGTIFRSALQNDDCLRNWQLRRIAEINLAVTALWGGKA
jgi:hypothetical protein